MAMAKFRAAAAACTNVAVKHGNFGFSSCLPSLAAKLLIRVWFGDVYGGEFAAVKRSQQPTPTQLVDLG